MTARSRSIGIAGTYTDQSGNATQPLLPSFRSPGQATFFRYRGFGTTAGTIADGERTRIAPQLYYYVGSFGLLGEYTEVSQDVSRVVATGTRTGSVDSDAWQLAASYFLTGEEEAYRGFKPNSVFSLANRTWGAWELVARYHVLDLDNAAFEGGAASFADPNTQASKASAWALGVNWYLNENLKWVLNYEHTSFDGSDVDGGDRPDEQAILTRVALGF